MPRNLLIHNIGQIVSGEFSHALIDGDALLVREGKIAAIGKRNSFDTTGNETVIDANGSTVTPGLIDSHFHPVIGDYAPRQKTVDFIDSCVHGGVTFMISAGEVHTPGRPSDAIGTKSLAIVAAQSWKNFRPGGVKVMGGGLLLAAGLQELDFKEMAEAGVNHLGEVGLGGFHDWEKAAEMVRWAKLNSMVVMMHVGGASIPGSDVIGAKHVKIVQPNIASHLNGGPTAPPLKDIETIISNTDCALEIIQCGNVTVISKIIELARAHSALNRVIVGTDMPSGTGVIPLGIVRTIAWISSLGDVPPEQVIAMASGNTASLYSINTGRILVGMDADLVIMDAAEGSDASDALSTIKIGDTVGISAVIIDGEIKVLKSRNTPPARRQVIIS